MAKIKLGLRASVAFAAVGIVTGSHGLAWAQSADEETTEKRIEDVIVVTSQKREQSLQDVPVSVSVLGGEELEENIIAEFDDLQFSVPGVNFQKASDRRNSSTTIRGIGTSVFSPGIEGSVAIVIDGVVAGREGAGLFDFSDLERVEILRGPQGTLFGKNASAGVVSLVSKRPTNEFSGRGSVSFGEYNDLSVNGAASGPIVEDKVLFRLSGQKNTRDGYIKNLAENSASPDKLNDRDDKGVRGQLMFLGDSWDVLLAADWADSSTHNGAFTQRSSSDIAGGLNAHRNAENLQYGIVPSSTNRNVAVDGLYLQDSTSSGASGTLNFEAFGHDFVWINSVRNWDFSGGHESDGTAIGGFAVNTWDLEQDQWSTEFRVASPAGEKLEYVAGVFAFEQETSSTGDIGLFDDSWFQATAGLPLQTILFFSGLPLDSELLTGSRQVTSFKETNLAVFGQGSYEFIEDTRLVLGGRLLSTSIEATSAQFQLPGTGSALSAADNVPESNPLLGDDDDTAFTWRVGLEHDLSDDVMLFGSISEGYKTGGFNLGFGVTPIAGTRQLRVIEPEVPTQIEVGIRSQWFDNSLTLNATAFSTKVEDFQAQAVRRVEGSGGGADTTFFDVINAGETSLRGAELDLLWNATDNTDLRFVIAYLDAEYDSFPGAPCYTTQVFAAGECEVIDGQSQQDLSGEKLPFAPDVTINAGITHNFDPVIDGKYTPWVSADLQYRSETGSSRSNSPFEDLEAFTIVNGQIGVRSDEYGWNFFFYGRNLFEQEFQENIFSTPFAENGGPGGAVGSQSQFTSFRSLRQFGIKATYEF